MKRSIHFNITIPSLLLALALGVTFVNNARSAPVGGGGTVGICSKCLKKSCVSAKNGAVSCSFSNGVCVGNGTCTSDVVVLPK